MIIALLVVALVVAPSDQIEGRAEALSGDTLQIDGVRIRLWGVEAPDLRQTCRIGERDTPCGEDARKALSRRIEGRTVRCRPSRSRTAEDVIVARCVVLAADLGSWLVRQGWALDARPESGGRYRDEEYTARHARRGLWAGHFVRPSD